MKIAFKGLLMGVVGCLMGVPATIRNAYNDGVVQVLNERTGNADPKTPHARNAHTGQYNYLTIRHKRRGKFKKRSR